MIVNDIAGMQISRDNAVFDIWARRRCRVHVNRLMIKSIYKKALDWSQAPRERFELPRHKDSGFRIHRNTGLCDLGRDARSSATVISMMQPHGLMEIHLHGRDHDVKLVADSQKTVRQVLVEAGILPSTVLVSFEGTILPHATVLSQSVKLLVTTVSSGG